MKSWCDRDASSWITVEQHAWTVDFQELWEHHPQDRGKVMVGKQKREIITSRWHECFGATPLPESAPKSFMFHGKIPPKSRPLPPSFQRLVEYMCEKDNVQYNQIVINWYKDGRDFIAQHSDYCVGLEGEVVVMNICPTA